MKFLRRNIDTIFVMLGNGCNMNCRYCLQHPLVHKPLDPEVNPDIYEFFAQVAGENPDGHVHLHFYGGEPLIYFETIKKIVAETKERKIPSTYSVITNGRAITDEMVRFFNKYDFSVMVSWDGYKSTESRRFDVFADPAQKERILHIKYLGLSGVVSSAAYPKEMLEAFQDISDEYYQIFGYPVGVNLDSIMDTGLADKSLLDVDYDRAGREMTEMARQYIQFSLTKDANPFTDPIKREYMDGLFHTAKHFYLERGGEWKRYTAMCGNGLNTLNMDLQGNLYPCHNTSESVGNIKDGYFQYLQRILAGDRTYLHRAECLECPALAFCQGGCKLVNDEARKATYCKLKQALYVPVLIEFLKSGQKILKEGAHHDG